MKIWIDADACPGPVKQVILKAILKRELNSVFVANKYIHLPKAAYIQSVLVEKGDDVADQYIVAHAEPNDLVITQDIPLAALLVPKQVVVISVHGQLFTEINIRERLSIRNFMQEVRDYGGRTAGPRPFSAKDIQQFANTFDQQLMKLSQKLQASR